MVLSNERVNEIIETGAAKSFFVRVRDISFALLSFIYQDKELAYKTVFGADAVGYDEYSKSPTIKFLHKELEEFNPNKKRGKKDDITFEENKSEIIKLIKETQDALERGDIDAKDALKIQADLRVKLNDKFSVNEAIQEQIVIVNCKYNAVCDCGRELYIPTKEDLMREYNLIENNK